MLLLLYCDERRSQRESDHKDNRLRLCECWEDVYNGKVFCGYYEYIEINSNNIFVDLQQESFRVFADPPLDQIL